MFEREVIIESDAGVHARPAMMLVQEAMKYSCDIYLIKDGSEANCKSIMSVLGLAITSGSKLVVRAVGESEEEAVCKLTTIIKEGFKRKDTEEE